MLSGRAAGCARGRRPAREPSAPRASLGASPRSPARPRHRPRAPQPGPPVPSRRWPLLCEMPEWFPSNVARNSPASISNIEFRTLELQRFRAVSKNDRGKLRATFVWGQLVHRSAARPSGALRAGAAWCFALPMVSSVWCSALPVVSSVWCSALPVAPMVFRASVASSAEILVWFPSNVARNSPASISNIEFRTLELQRFRAVSKNDRGKLRATFVWTVTCCSPTRSSMRVR